MSDWNSEIFTEYYKQIKQMDTATRRVYYRYVADESERLAKLYDDEYRNLTKLCYDNRLALYASNAMYSAYNTLETLKHGRDYYRKMNRVYDRACMN